MAEIDGRRIERLAARLRIGIWCVVIVAGLLYAAGRLGLSAGSVYIMTRPLVPDNLPELWIARDISAVLILASLVRLAGMLGLIAHGEHFSPPVTRAFRGFALFLALAAAVTLIAPLVALFRPATDGNLHIALNFRDVLTMLVTGALFLVANLLDEAQRLEADLREIV